MKRPFRNQPESDLQLKRSFAKATKRRPRIVVHVENDGSVTVRGDRR